MSTTQSSLGRRALFAGLWAILTGFAGTGLRFGSSLIMTRLLVPEAFGILALAIVLSVVIALLSDIGLRQYVIAKDDGNRPEVLGVILSLSALRGLVIAIVTAMVAGVIVLLARVGVFMPDSVYAHPDMPVVLALMGATAIVLGFKSPNMLLLDRNLDLRKIGLIELATQFVTTVASIVLAYYWRNVYSMIAGIIVGSFATVILSIVWVEGPRYQFLWDRKIAGELIRFGRWILLSTLAFVLAQNADRLLLGNWISAAELGLYAVALNLLTSVEQLMSRPFTAVALPAFSEVVRRNDGSMRAIYFRTRLPLDLAAVTAAGLLFATGQFLVDVLYDPRYQAAGRTLQILSFGLIFTRYNIAVAVHNAMMEPQVQSWTNLTKLISIVVLIPIGQAIAGFEGAIFAIALHMAPAMLLTWWHNRRHGLVDVPFELKTLLCWPVGYAVGLFGVWLLKTSFPGLLSLLPHG